MRPTGSCRGGFTLVEVLCTLSIALVMALWATPPLQRFLAVRAVEGQAQVLASTLRLARSEALKRGGAVSVCAGAIPPGSAPRCTEQAGWAMGWLVFADADRNGTFNPARGDELITVQQPLSGDLQIQGQTPSQQGRSTVTFLQTGPCASGEVLFTVQAGSASVSGKTGAPVRLVVLSAQGRVQVKEKGR